jgi:hypothetical protein
MTSANEWFMAVNCLLFWDQVFKARNHKIPECWRWQGPGTIGSLLFPFPLVSFAEMALVMPKWETGSNVAEREVVVWDLGAWISEERWRAISWWGGEGGDSWDSGAGLGRVCLHVGLLLTCPSANFWTQYQSIVLRN